MSRFLEDALQIFETASQAANDGAVSHTAILIDDSGALRIVDSAGWHPEALKYHYGVRTVYQITRTPAGVKVAGQSGAQSFVLETSRPACLNQSVYAQQYEVTGPRLLT